MANSYIKSRLLAYIPNIVLLFLVSNFLNAQSITQDGKFEVVYTNYDIYFENSPTVNLVTGYKDQSILVACIDYSKSNPFIIYQSVDQGTNWQVIIQEFDSTFFSIISIKQLSPKHICEVVGGFSKDSAGNYRKNYWIRSSDDLGKTWIKHNAGGLPLGFHFKDNKGVFASTTNDTAVLWTTVDYGLSWRKQQLPFGMENTAPAMLGEKEFIFFNNTNDGINKDTLYYTNNIDAGLWESKKLNKNFWYNNFIVFDKNRILSAKNVSANIGTLALSYILETKDAGDTWSTPINTLEDSGNARRGLLHNYYLDSNNMVFLGPNVLYSTSNSGELWEKAIWGDSLNGGTRGVYLFYNTKLDRKQLIFPVNQYYIMRYTIPGVVGIKEPLVTNKELKLYPNPVKNNLYIDLDQSEKIIGDIIVWSIEGKEVIRKNLNNMHIKYLNVEDLKSGVYIIKLKTVNGNYSNRFVK